MRSRKLERRAARRSMMAGRKVAHRIERETREAAFEIEVDLARMWNDLYPIGVRVRWIDDSRPIAQTVTLARVMGSSLCGSSAVVGVWIDGVPNWVPLNRLRPVDEHDGGGA